MPPTCTCTASPIRAHRDESNTAREGGIPPPYEVAHAAWVRSHLLHIGACNASTSILYIARLPQSCNYYFF